MSDPFSIGRRDLIKLSSAGVLTAAAATLPAASRAETPKIEAEEHWAMKGPVKLYLYRKRRADLQVAAPVLFLVHGSTFSSRGSFDLIVPGKPGFSAMDHFAGLEIGRAHV